MAERLREHEEKTSHISLCDTKMEMFPLILDYLYDVYYTHHTGSLKLEETTSQK